MSTLTQFSAREVEVIRRAFTAYSGATRRWKDLATRGATDTDLRIFAARELGEGGSSGPPPTVRVAMHNNPPRIWLYEYGPATKAKPTLVGQALLDAARELFQVGFPPPADGQLSLLQLLDQNT